MGQDAIRPKCRYAYTASQRFVATPTEIGRILRAFISGTIRLWLAAGCPLFEAFVHCRGALKTDAKKHGWCRLSKGVKLDFRTCGRYASYLREVIRDVTMIRVALATKNGLVPACLSVCNPQPHTTPPSLQFCLGDKSGGRCQSTNNKRGISQPGSLTR